HAEPGSRRMLEADRIRDRRYHFDSKYSGYSHLHGGGVLEIAVHFRHCGISILAVEPVLPRPAGAQPGLPAASNSGAAQRPFPGVVRVVEGVPHPGNWRDTVAADEEVGRPIHWHPNAADADPRAPR